MHLQAGFGVQSAVLRCFFHTSILRLLANCREGADAVRKALCELEAAGYLQRTRIRSENGSYIEGAWSIYEIPGKDYP